MPKRKIKKSYRNVTGVLSSQKVGRMIESESTLERDLYNLLEFDPMVSSYEEQPVTLAYRTDDGKNSKYTPDAVIYLKRDPEFIWKYSPFRKFFEEPEPAELDKESSARGGMFFKPKMSGIFPAAILVEVKYRTDLAVQWKESKSKFKAARAFAGEKNWQFRILTEREIRTRLLTNMKFIRPFVRREFNVEMIMKVLEKLAQTESCTMNELIESLPGDNFAQREYIPVIWHLVGQHEIEVNWYLPLTLNSVLQSVSQF